ncbi:diacylglycerol/lipid kinase family protein [Salinispira pacifica]|nr:hypothetical protein [Salinispira pacifica]
MSDPYFRVLINPHRYPRYIKRLKKKIRKVPGGRIQEAGSKEDFSRGIRDFLYSDEKYLLVWGGDGTAHLAINSWMKHLEENDLPGDSGGGKPGGPNSSGETGKGDTGRSNSGGGAALPMDQKAIGFLRGGSGNGIQDSYEVPFLLSSQISTYLQSMQQGYTQQVDLLTVGSGRELRYAQLAGTGFDAELLRRREAALARRGGRPSGLAQYLKGGLSLFREDFLARRNSFHLIMENGKYALRSTRANAELGFTRLEYEQTPLMIEAGTRPFYGRMFKVCPDVVCNDGRMDVYQFMFENKWQILSNLLPLWNGWHNRINRNQAEKGRPLIERYEVERLKIISATPFLYHIDGELEECREQNGEYSLSLGIAPGAIRFLVPGSFHRKFHPENLYHQGKVWK